MWPLLEKIGLTLFEQTQGPGPSWFVLSEAFGFVMPLFILTVVWVTVYTWLYPEEAWVLVPDARRRSNSRLANGLRKCARVWLTLVLFVNFAAICAAFIRAGGPLSGFWEASRIYVLFNVVTYAFNIVLIAPALGAYLWAQKVEERHSRPQAEPVA
jgi:hypothetical protein